MTATRVEWLASVDSTNEESLRRAREGAQGPLWIAAWEQTRGRGRQGREWRSPRGNLAASLLIVDPCPVALAPQLGFVAGVALAQAVQARGAGARLKWPNDLVCDGAKMSGLLLEATQTAGGLACVVGFGVNVREAPRGLPYAATSLAEQGVDVTAELLLDDLAAAMDDWLARWARGAGFALVREAWLRHAAGLGGTMRVESAGRSLTGIFRGLDQSGQLLLETQSGVETIAAGDVFLTAQAPVNGQEIG